MLSVVLLVLAIGLPLVYALLLFGAWRWQERIVFQPPRAVGGPGPRAHKLEYPASDGVPLHAFVVGEARTDVPVLLAFHGNAELARWLLPWAREVVRETGACVVLPEYRGYDDLPGIPTYSGAAADARAALLALDRELNVSPDRVVLFGHSLGSAIATELAREVPVRALLLQSPFSSARAMAKRMPVPGISGLWRLISRVHYDSIRHVAELACPVFVAHGARDRVIPLHMGEAVFAASRYRGEFLLVPAAGHNDVPELGGDAYWRWLRAGVERVLTGAPAGRPPEP